MARNDTSSHRREWLEVKAEAEAAVRAVEKALKKHVGLVKKRRRITSIVAMIEKLRGDLWKQDLAAARRHLKEFNELTSGFVGRVLSRKK